MSLFSWMRWLRQWFPAARPERRSTLKAGRRRPALEALEDRTVPTAMFVVPAQGANGVNSFASLAQAVALAQPGDSITVQPGSNPTPGSAAVTITQAGVVLLGGAGAAGLRAAGTEVGHVVLGGNGDAVVDLFVDQVDIKAGKTGQIIRSNIFNNGGIAQLAADGSETDGSNAITGNTFLGSAAVKLGSKAATAANDQVSNNLFVNHFGVDAIQAFNESAGLLISGNTINGNDPTTAINGVLVQDSVGTVSGNQIRLGKNLDTVGITVQDGDDINADISTDNRTTNVTVSGNAITTGGAGTGIFTVRNSDINPFSVVIANNALAANLVGVYVQGNTDTGDTDFGAVSAGGLSQGSITTANGPVNFSANSGGGNDFRGYTGTKGNFAVLADDHAFGNSSHVLAQNNIFSVTDPSLVADTTNAPGSVVDVTNPQSGGTANLNAMFASVALAAPDLATVNALGGASAADQAKGTVASTPAVTFFVDSLYVSLLGRAAGNGEDQFWIAALQGGFLNEEQVLAGFLTAGEYYAKVTQGSASPNGTWIQSLYTNLLGRQAGPAEINYWLAVLPVTSAGTVVNGFLTSQEFRTDQVNAFYGLAPIGVVPAVNILKRQGLPAAGDVAYWAQSPLDLRSIETMFLATPEFQANG